MAAPPSPARSFTRLIRAVPGWLHAPWLVLLLLLTPFAMDAILRSAPWPRWIEAVFDESGHAATTLLLFSALSRVLGMRVRFSWVIGALAGGILIDVDHIPAEIFGWDFLSAGAKRPYTHALVTLVVFAGAALAYRGRWRSSVLAAAFGLATHFLRDLATGGLPFLWPLTTKTVALSYVVYTVVLISAAAVVLAGGDRDDERQRATQR